jgi:HEAT repeat protein
MFISMSFIPARHLLLFMIISFLFAGCARESEEEILQRRMGDKKLLNLIGSLQSSSPDAQIRAADQLGVMTDEALSALPALENTMNDPDPAVRVAAARAYWRLSGDLQRTLPVLYDSLEHDRSAALSTLREIGPPATQPIIRALDDPDARIRRSAAMTLGWMADLAQGAIPKLTQMTGGDPDPDVKSATANALAAIGPGQPGSTN